jgi:hypothetical protein
MKTIKNLIIISVLLLLFTNCSLDRKREQIFETQIKEKLLDPSSYKLIKFECIDTITIEEMKEKISNYDTLLIRYSNLSNFYKNKLDTLYIWASESNNEYAYSDIIEEFEKENLDYITKISLCESYIGLWKHKLSEGNIYVYYSVINARTKLIKDNLIEFSLFFNSKNELEIREINKTLEDASF